MLYVITGLYDEGTFGEFAVFISEVGEDSTRCRFDVGLSTKTAIKVFNHSKTKDNRIELVQAKINTHKSLEQKLKSEYVLLRGK